MAPHPPSQCGASEFDFLLHVASHVLKNALSPLEQILQITLTKKVLQIAKWVGKNILVVYWRNIFAVSADFGAPYCTNGASCIAAILPPYRAFGFYTNR